jgi:hypothetical protein
MLIFSCSAVSLTITVLFGRNNFLAHSSFCVAVVVAGQPELSASVTLIWPFLNASIHSYITIKEIALSPN